MATDTTRMQASRRVKPWIAVAMLLAVVILGYYLFLGVRFGLAFSEAASSAGQIEGKSPGSLVLPDSGFLESRLTAGEGQLQERRAWYSLAQGDDLMARLSAVAGESRVDLISVTGVEPVEETRGTIQYLVQPMTVSLQGDDPESIYRFISLLGEAPPVTTVSSISMSGLEGATTAQVRLLVFFLAGTPLESREGAR